MSRTRNNSGRQQGGGPQNGGGQAGQPGTRKKRTRKKRVDPAKFWGDPDLLPPVPHDIRVCKPSDAVATSLGRAPIPGHEASSAHYFRLVYDRSVNLAFALAAAGGLDQPAPVAAATAEDDGVDR